MNSGFCHRSQNWLSTRRRPTGSICQPHSEAARVGLGTPPMMLPWPLVFLAGSAVSQMLM